MENKNFIEWMETTKKHEAEQVICVLVATVVFVALLLLFLHSLGYAEWVAENIDIHNRLTSYSNVCVFFYLSMTTRIVCRHFMRRKELNAKIEELKMETGKKAVDQK
ncbi:MAG: hypothetical protein R3Y53_08320 [Bacillota bacterium]